MNIQRTPLEAKFNSGSPYSFNALSNSVTGSAPRGKLTDDNGDIRLNFAELLNSPPSQPVSSSIDSSSEIGSNETRHDVKAPDGKLRETFNAFVGQTFFGQLISSMRSTQDDAAYFNGGRAEKIFQGQLDQVLSEELSKSSASQIADPMFKLFQANRAG